MSAAHVMPAFGIPYARSEIVGGVEVKVCPACGERVEGTPVTDAEIEAIEDLAARSRAWADLTDPTKWAAFRYAQHFTAAAEAEKGGS